MTDQGRTLGPAGDAAGKVGHAALLPHGRSVRGRPGVQAAAGWPALLARRAAGRGRRICAGTTTVPCGLHTLVRARPGHLQAHSLTVDHLLYACRKLQGPRAALSSAGAPGWVQCAAPPRIKIRAGLAGAPRHSGCNTRTYSAGREDSGGGGRRGAAHTRQTKIEERERKSQRTSRRCPSAYPLQLRDCAGGHRKSVGH